MKKVFFAVMVALVVACFAACSAQEKTNDRDDAPILPEVSDTTDSENKSNEEEGGKEKTGTPEIVVDVKPLEDADGESLSKAAAALGFENQKLFHAIANAIGKTPSDVTKADIDNIHYIAVGPENKDTYTVYVGYVDYVDKCLSDWENENEIMQELNELVMVSEFIYDKETDDLSDLGNLKNVEMFEIYDVAIEDVSFIKEYKNLVLGYFKNNSITDVSCLKGYNPESLVELDLTGNDIEDWSPLYDIKEKVTVFYGVSDGMPITITLKDKLEQESTDSETDLNAEKTPVLVDESGNAVDFSSLFG